MALKFTDHFLLDRHAMNRRVQTACGMKKTASTTTCCVFPMASATAEGSLDGRTVAFVCDFGY